MPAPPEATVSHGQSSFQTDAATLGDRALSASQAPVEPDSPSSAATGAASCRITKGACRITCRRSTGILLSKPSRHRIALRPFQRHLANKPAQKGAAPAAVWQQQVRATARSYKSQPTLSAFMLINSAACLIQLLCRSRSRWTWL